MRNFILMIQRAYFFINPNFSVSSVHRYFVFYKMSNLRLNWFKYTKTTENYITIIFISQTISILYSIFEVFHIWLWLILKISSDTIEASISPTVEFPETLMDMRISKFTSLLCYCFTSYQHSHLLYHLKFYFLFVKWKYDSLLGCKNKQKQLKQSL